MPSWGCRISPVAGDGRQRERRATGPACRLRYDHVGHLDPIARWLLGDRRLTWIQDLRLDRTSGVGRLSFEAEADPARLHGAADVTLESVDGGTVRRLDDQLVVAVPLIGPRAERRILPGLVRRLDIKATPSSSACGRPNR